METAILFLDIDGVVSSSRNLVTGTKFDQVALKLIEKLQKKYNFQIVLSSSHRKHIRNIIEWVTAIEKDYGVCLNIHPNWRTVTGMSSMVDEYDASHDNRDYWMHLNKLTDPDSLTKETTFYWRGWEIQQWLNEYEKENGCKPIYACIDDSRDLYPIPYSHFVHVDQGEMYSLQLSHYDALNAVFNRQINGGKIID